MAVNVPNIKIGPDSYGGTYSRATPVISVDEAGNYVAAGSGGGTTSTVSDPALESAVGTSADAAWGGTGVGTLIAISKAIWGKLAATLTVTINGALPAGSNAVGTVGVTSSVLPTGGATSAKQDAITAAVAASNLAVAATTAQTSALSGSIVLKTSAGKLLTTYVTTGNSPGYLMLFDATSAPADGNVTPKECIYCPASSTTSLDYPISYPSAYTTGITAVFSSTGPFTKTASATAFIAGVVA